MIEPVVDTERAQRLAETIHLANRTIVSKDIPGVLDAIERALGDPLIRHRFPSGADHGTWVVPPRWDVREAWLKGPDGRVIASYTDHPLFLAPYSQAFRGRVGLDELKRHVRMHPTLPDAFCYEHRVAYDFQRRLNEWVLTLPRQTVEALPEGEYEVCIDVEVEPGEMLVAEYVLPGETDECIALLSDYCHPGQFNDSVSGIVAMVEVLARLRAQPKRRYTYRWFIFPETIGSCVFIAANPSILQGMKLAIFSEMVGWGGPFTVTHRKLKPQAVASHLARELAVHWPDTRVLDLFEGWGNDELIFEYAGVPSLSVQRLEIPEYHSSADHWRHMEPESITRAVDMIHRLCTVMERDAVYAPVQPVPFYMTRFGLYRDAIFEQTDFALRRNVLYGLDGRQSLLEIASSLGYDFDVVEDFAGRIFELGLLRRVG